MSIIAPISKPVAYERLGRFFRRAFTGVAPAQCGQAAAGVPKALPNSSDATPRRTCLGVVLVAPDGPAPGQKTHPAALWS